MTQTPLMDQHPIESALTRWLSPLKNQLPDLYLVGGVVRDLMLSRPAKDIDLMCKDAEQFARKLGRTCRGIVIPFEKKADEPCYRVVDRDHRDVFIDIAEMRGHTVFDDLNRRDFNMNAIAIRIDRGQHTETSRIGTIVDPLNGCRDINEKQIRMTSEQAFVSDPLRILRAVRFAAELEFDIEETTLQAMQTHAGKLLKVSSERILAELIKIFASPKAAYFVRLMDQLGILDILFPEIRAMKGCAQNTYHHLDVWNHSLAVLDACEAIINHLQEHYGPVASKVEENLNADNRRAVLKLTALLHDIGKPSTRGFKEETGQITFYGHDDAGAKMITEIACRLRMSVRDQEFMKTLISEHLNVLFLSRPGVKSITRMKLIRKLKDDVIPLFILGLADTRAILGPSSSQAERIRYQEWSTKMIIAYYEELKARIERRPMITGKDLMAMGMKPGPEMGVVLRQIREAQDAGMIQDRDQALKMVREGFMSASSS